MYSTSSTVWLCWLFDFMNRLNMCMCLSCFKKCCHKYFKDENMQWLKNQEVLFFLVLSIHWHLQNLIFITLLFSFLLICPLWMCLYVLPSALIRCKSICCPPLLSFCPANVIKPPPAESAPGIPHFSSPLFPLYQPSLYHLLC